MQDTGPPGPELNTPVLENGTLGALPTVKHGDGAILQGWAIQVLEGRCPACFRCFPLPAHLTGHYQADDW